MCQSRMCVECVCNTTECICIVTQLHLQIQYVKGIALSTYSIKNILMAVFSFPSQHFFISERYVHTFLDVL